MFILLSVNAFDHKSDYFTPAATSFWNLNKKPPIVSKPFGLLS